MRTPVIPAAAPPDNGYSAGRGPGRPGADRRPGDGDRDGDGGGDGTRRRAALVAGAVLVLLGVVADAIVSSHFHPKAKPAAAAALWEYTFLAGSLRLRAIDLGMVAGSHGCALNVQTADSDWSRMHSVLTNFEGSFQTPA